MGSREMCRGAELVGGGKLGHASSSQTTKKSHAEGRTEIKPREERFLITLNDIVTISAAGLGWTVSGRWSLKERVSLPLPDRSVFAEQETYHTEMDKGFLV